MALFSIFILYISILFFIFQSYIENSGRKDLWWTRRHLDGMYLHAVVVFAMNSSTLYKLAMAMINVLCLWRVHWLLNIQRIGLNAMTLHKRKQEYLQISNILFSRNSNKKCSFGTKISKGTW